MSQTTRGTKGSNNQAASDRSKSGQDRHDRSTAEHHERVAVAAYFHAEHHGFGGDPLEDWLAAEAEINAASKQGEDVRFH